MANTPRNMDATTIFRAVYDETTSSFKVTDISSRVPADYDEIDLTYTGDNLTTVEYLKDSAVVATVTLSYSGSQLTNVVWS